MCTFGKQQITAQLFAPLQPAWQALVELSPGSCGHFRSQPVGEGALSFSSKFLFQHTERENEPFLVKVQYQMPCITWEYSRYFTENLSRIIDAELSGFLN